MKIVLDTNVFVSAVFFGGVPGKVLRAWRDGKVQIVLSTEIVAEYVEVLHRLGNRYPTIETEAVIELLLAGAEIISVPPLDKPASDDPDDDKFIACALASKAQVIISGDQHLLVMDGFLGLEIILPSVFLKKYLKG